MPTLTDPGNNIRIPAPLTGTGRSVPTGHAARILSALSAASTGNTVEDHLEDIIARLGHSVSDSNFKGVYSNSATYAVGDEVYWVDGNSRKLFFKRLTAGDDGGNGTPRTHTADWSEISTDLHDIAVGDDSIASTAAVLEQEPNGAIRFNRRFITEITDRQTATQVQSLIDVLAGRLATTSRWRGTWSAGTYAVADYVAHDPSATVYRCLVTRGAGDTTTPATDTTGWAAASSLETLVAHRLRDMQGLLAERLGLDPAQADRGQWLARHFTDESYEYVEPPMQWGEAWAAGSSYRYGRVVTHLSKLWVLTNDATIHTSKTGAGSAPGTDGDWHEITVGLADWAREGNSDTIPVLKQASGFRGGWVAIGENGSIRLGDMVRYDEALYVARSSFTRGTITPNLAPDSWHLITDYQGHWKDTGYPEGTFVQHGAAVYIAERDVETGDAEPGSASDEKWLLVTGGATTSGGFVPSETVEADRAGRAVLASPGTLGVWSAPNAAPRGAVTNAEVSFFNAAAQTFADTPTRIRIDSVPVDLDQWFEIDPNDNGRVRVTHPAPPNIALRLRLVFTAPYPAGASLTFAVQRQAAGDYQHAQVLLTLDPQIAADASASNPWEITGNVSLAGISLGRGDTLMLVYVARGFSGGDPDGTARGLLQGGSLGITVPGTPPVAEAADTYPVQARPLRDLRSVDTTEPNKIAYSSDALTFDGDPGSEHGPIRNASDPSATPGDGWRIENTQNRGAESQTTDIVVTRDGVELGVQYTATYTFADARQDQENPDEVRIGILVRDASDSGDEDFADFTEAAHQLAFDVELREGDLAGRNISVGTRVINQWTVPAALEGLITFHSGALSGTATAFIIANTHRVRMELRLKGSLTSDPGELRIELIQLDSNFNAQTTLHGFRVKDEWSSPNPTAGSPSTFDVAAHTTTGSETRFGVRLTAPGGTALADWNVEGLSIQVGVEILWQDTSHGNVSLSAVRTLNTGDRVAIRARNSTDSTQYTRPITANNQRLLVWNQSDVAGRIIVATGAISAEREVVLTQVTQASQTWWRLNAQGRLQAIRSARQMTITVEMPGRTRVVRAELWRAHLELGSRERISARTFSVSASTESWESTALALAVGEQLIVTTDAVISGTVTVTAQAQTPVNVPQTQVTVGGLLRERVVAEARITSVGNWTEIPLLAFSWGESATLHFSVEDATAADGAVDSFSVHTGLLRRQPALAATRIGSAPMDDDRGLLVRGDSGTYRLVPVFDGRIAITWTSLHAFDVVVVAD